MDILNFFYKYNLDGKVRKKYEWKCVMKSACLATSLHLVQARIVKTCPIKKKYHFCKLNKGQLPTFYIPIKNLHVF